MTTLFTALADRAACAPDNPALVFVQRDASPVTATAGELYARALHAGAALRDHLRPGDLVVIAAPVSLELVVAYWAILSFGGVATVFHHPSIGASHKAYWRRVHEFADATAARAIVTRREDLGRATGQQAGAACVVGVDMGGQSKQTHDLPDPARSTEDAAYVQFSSGTTRAPRGAVLSHRAVLNAVQGLTERFHWTNSDVSVGWLPLSHDMGLVTQLLMPLLTGASSILVQPAHWVRHPEVLLQAVTAHRGTMTWMPNFAFLHCVKTIRDADLTGVDLSSWRLVGNGAELSHTPTMKRFAERFARYGLARNALAVGYGLAENVVGVSATEPGQPLTEDWVSLPDLATGIASPVQPGTAGSRPIANCGAALPGTEIRVADGDGTELAERHVGEISVRGGNLFSGFLGVPTQDTLDDGWYPTGDLGYLLDGDLHVLERRDDMLIVGGRNIRPHDIEVLAREGLGDDAALVVAFGIRDPRRQTEAAVVVCARSPGDGEGATAAGSIRRAVQEELDVALADVRFVERRWIPRTTSGKVARKAARQRYVRTYLSSP